MQHVGFTVLLQGTGLGRFRVLGYGVGSSPSAPCKTAVRVFAAFASHLVFCSGLSFAQNLQPSAIQEIRTILQEKAARTPVQRKLASHLHLGGRLARGELTTTIIPSLGAVMKGLEFDGSGRVHVDMVANVNSGLLAEIAARSGRVESALPNYNTLRAWIPLLMAETIAARLDVTFIQPAEKSVHGSRLPRGTIGFALQASSTQRHESVRRQLKAALAARASRRLTGGLGLFMRPINTRTAVSHGADLVQSQGFTAAGIKVGVLSDGVDSLGTLQAAGNLPGVTVLNGQAGSGDEGAAMLEIIYDLAPGATLYFATADTGSAQFATNIQNLAAAGCKIIVDDYTYFNEGAFQDGIIARAVNTVTASGVLFFSSAGNSGNLDSGTSGTWEGDFVPSGTWIPVVPAFELSVHAFDGSHNYNTVGQESSNPVTLKWSDPLGGSCNDYDLFILDSTMTAIKDSSTNYQTCTQDPLEFANPPSAGDRVVIALYSGVARALRLDTNRGRLSIATSGSTVGHNAAATALTVAATPAQPTIFTSGNQSPESYSSDGPRKMFYHPNGTAITSGNVLFGSNGGTTFSKVDFTAADCGQSAAPGFSPFCGTSAAAPAAAAIAALVWSASPALLAAQVVARMKASALQTRAGFSLATVGSGIVMANSMLEPLALTVSKTHSGNFVQGQRGAVYRVLVSNRAGASATSAAVSVTEIPTSQLTLVSMAGIGWTCSGMTCTRSDALAGGSSYPPITVTVNVAPNAPTQVTNQVTLSGAGSATASDPTTIIQVAPAAVTPDNGSGSSQTFAFLYVDSLGAADLRQEWVWFTPVFGSGAANSCMLYYEQSTNLLRLLNDAGSGWLAGTPGSNAVLQNSQCSTNLSATTLAPGGNNLTISLPLTFTTAFAGTKQIWMYAAGSTANGGWQQLGSWTVPLRPTAVSVTPGTGSGALQTFQFSYSDPAGAADLRQEWVWFTTAFGNGAAYSCMLYYEQASNILRLLNDAGVAWLSGTAGSNATLQNSQCSIGLSATTITQAANFLTLSVPLTFTPTFAGAKQVWMYTAGSTGNSGWQQLGSWTVPASPAAVSVTPGTGNGMVQTFQFLYSDPAGAADLRQEWIWFTTTFGNTAANSCMLYHEQASNLLRLLNDAGAAWLAGTPGTNATLQNSQCSISLSATTLTPSGNNLTLSVPLTFTAAFAGAKQVWMYALGSTSSGWQQRGIWTVPASASPAALSVTPNAGNGAVQTFQLQYSDPAGAADLRQEWVWFTAAFGSSAANSCMLYYEQASNLLRLINDAGSAWLPGTPGSTGTLQNSQCSVSLSATTVLPSGNNLTLSVPLTFTAGFAGAKQVWMYALGSAGNSGWQQMGSWTPH